MLGRPEEADLPDVVHDADPREAGLLGRGRDPGQVPGEPARPVRLGEVRDVQTDLHDASSGGRRPTGAPRPRSTLAPIRRCRGPTAADAEPSGSRRWGRADDHRRYASSATPCGADGGCAGRLAWFLRPGEPVSPGRSAGRPEGGHGLVAFEAQQQLAEQLGERGLLVGGEPGEQAPLIVQVQRSDRIGELHAAWIERDVQAASVLGVDHPLHEAHVLQPVQSVGDRARGAHQRLAQASGGEPVGVADATQGGQYVPRRSGEAVLGEHGVQGRIDVSLCAAEPGDDPDRVGVEIRALLRPLPAHLVDVIRLWTARRRRLLSLHVKIMCHTARRSAPGHDTDLGEGLTARGSRAEHVR